MQYLPCLLPGDIGPIEERIELACPGHDIYAGLRIENGCKIPQTDYPVGADGRIDEPVRHAGDKVYITAADSLQGCPVA